MNLASTVLSSVETEGGDQAVSRSQRLPVVRGAPFVVRSALLCVCRLSIEVHLSYVAIRRLSVGGRPKVFVR
eukprot:1105491-Lingulodinium_polyedra.AAC.1